MKLDKLFKPKTIAVIGASAQEGSIGNDYMKALTNLRDPNSVYPVNPKHEEILGIKTYKSITDVPEEVDVAYTLTPSKYTPRTVEECVEKGVKMVIVVSGGFSEKGNENLKRKMLEAVEETDTRIVGPNCMGVHSIAGGISFPNPITSTKLTEKEGNIAFVSQSGGMAQIFMNLLIERGGGISKMVSTGNEADLQFTDYLEYFAEDDETDVIAGYVEQIRNGKRFLKTTKKISRKKPVVLMKVGRGEAGKRAAKSHTGSIAGSSEVYTGLFKQTGVIEARTLNELVDYATTFACLDPTEIKKSGIITGPGGLGVIIADVCEENEIEVPKFSENLQSNLVEFLPSYAQVRNPLDMTLAAIINPEILTKSIEVLSGEENIDIIPYGASGPIIEDKKQKLKECREKSDIPLAVVFPTINLLDKKGLENIRSLTKAGIPFYSTAEGFAKSMKAMNYYYRFISKKSTNNA